MKTLNNAKHALSFFTVILLCVMTAVTAFAEPSQSGNTILIGYYAEPGMMNGAEDGAE